jgi:hypothetical protein
MLKKICLFIAVIPWSLLMIRHANLYLSILLLFFQISGFVTWFLLKKKEKN